MRAIIVQRIRHREKPIWSRQAGNGRHMKTFRKMRIYEGTCRAFLCILLEKMMTLGKTLELLVEEVGLIHSQVSSLQKDREN